MMKTLILALLWSLTAPLWAQAIPAPLQHDIRVSLAPEQHRLTVSDRITLPQPVRQLRLQLHPGLEPRFAAGDGGTLDVERIDANDYREVYRITLPEGTARLQVDYAGTIHDALGSSRAEQARGFRSTRGLIDGRGVFLSASSQWYPQLSGYPYLTYSMQVELPRGWSSVSQGTRAQQTNNVDTNHEHWTTDKPQEEIYLIAAPFTEYTHEVGGQQGPIAAQVFLRKPEPALAGKYLEATASYLQMYEQLLGPYPYSKFALVENFWETGFGMPSFTLLGSRVIRLPFIINSSYPHEILHNWWGNGVYVDFASGNWSEGLTAYLADHLIKEQQGQAVGYRLQSLQKYRDYAAENRDFPLRQFRGRHSSATEAVGYGKTLMLFHMLRRELGDATFIESLQTLYRDYRFRIASFDDVQQVFERVSARPLASFFQQWVERTGAPELALTAVEVEPQDGHFRLRFELHQVQPGEAYRLQVPVAVSLDGQTQADEFMVTMTAKQQTVELELPVSPTRIDVDPAFDLFRKLAIAETPPAFTQVFGAARLLVVLPAKSQKMWQAFARDMSHMGPDKVRVVRDDAIEALPDDQAVVVLGWDNRFAATIQAELSRHPVTFASAEVRFGQQDPTGKRGHTFAAVTRVHGADGTPQPRALIATDRAAALPGLGRKIPHYHKYSYLAFAGDEPENRIKGRWPVIDSPLSRALQPNAERGRLPATAALIDPVSVFDTSRMLQTIRYLSASDLHGRGLGSTGLEQAAQYIAQAFKEAGLQPGAGDGSYLQPFTAIDEHGTQHRLHNVIAVIPGRHPTLASENVVVGAHYDHLGLGWPDVRDGNSGQIHHGADDNASGVAVLLELARTLGRALQPDRSVVFAAFSAEEAGRLGSKHYVEQQTTYPVSRSIGMLNLDTVGRLGDDRLMVLGAESATEWPHIFRGIGFVTGIPTAMVSEPLDASDQVSFHEAGVPAVQLFSGAHTDYHRPGDVADKIDANGLVKVAEVSKQVIDYLAAREQPMTSRLAGHSVAKEPGAGRKVSLGTIPDFSHDGNGYRLDGVVPDSPADRAGLERADIIVAINGVTIDGLRDMSQLLKTLQAGQALEIRYLRGGVQREAEAVLTTK